MRHHDWPERLFSVVKTAQSSEFEWGQNDCALFVFDCVKAMTGADYLVNCRGKYQTRRGAMTVLEEVEEVSGLPELADKYLGERISLSRAQRGDVVLLTVGDVKAFGIVAGDCAVFLTIDGVRTIPVRECTYAWSVK